MQVVASQTVSAIFDAKTQSTRRSAEITRFRADTVSMTRSFLWIDSLSAVPNRKAATPTEVLSNCSGLCIVFAKRCVLRAFASS